ncbi:MULTISPECIES: hypothetical protein [Delftia]|jgi:hypothetical protein|uniref:hypothetical protein n=1 Tax=Delftia acidovorans TaxID=80866 RepID=UPI00062D9E9F
MSTQEILFTIALLGSALYLFDRIAGVFAALYAKKKAKLEVEKEALLKAEAVAKEKARLEQAKEAQNAVLQLVEIVNNMKKGLAGFSDVLPVPAPSAPSGAVAAGVQEVPVPVSAASAKTDAEMSLEGKISFLASTVMAQAEQMESIQATLRQLTEAGGAPKRRSARKGADGSGIVTPASPAGASAGNRSAREVPSLDGLENQPPLQGERQGEFDIVK